MSEFSEKQGNVEEFLEKQRIIWESGKCREFLEEMDISGNFQRNKEMSEFLEKQENVREFCEKQEILREKRNSWRNRILREKGNSWRNREMLGNLGETGKFQGILGEMGKYIRKSLSSVTAILSFSPYLRDICTFTFREVY